MRPTSKHSYQCFLILVQAHFQESMLWLFLIQTFISLVIHFPFKWPRQEAITKQQQNKTTFTAKRIQECSLWRTAVKLEDSFALSQWITMLYSIRFFSDSFRASSVRNRSASLPFPPYGENTRGLKEPCSTSIFRWLQCHFSSFSLLAKAELSFWFRTLGGSLRKG